MKVLAYNHDSGLAAAEGFTDAFSDPHGNNFVDSDTSQVVIDAYAFDVRAGEEP